MLYPDLSRLALACPTGANNDHEAGGSNDPPPGYEPSLLEKMNQEDSYNQDDTNERREAWLAERQRSRERMSEYANPPLTYEESYYVDWKLLSQEEKDAVIEILKIQQEKKRGSDVGATSMQKRAWAKGERYWMLKLSPELQANFGYVKWWNMLKNEERIPWYWGGEGGGVCGLEAGENSQGGDYGCAVLNPNSNWGPNHGGA